MDDERDPIPPSPVQYRPPGDYRPPVNWSARPDSVEPMWWPAWTAFVGLALSFCVVGGPIGLVAVVFGATMLRTQTGPAAKIAIIIGVLDMIISGAVLWSYRSLFILCRTTCD